MSIRAAMHYDVNPTTDICTNPECPQGLPHYARIGKLARRNCPDCGQPMRRIRGEPYGTPHLPCSHHGPPQQ